MKLKEYRSYLNNLAKKYPEADEMEIYTSSDDEGNAYVSVKFGPCIMVAIDKPGYDDIYEALEVTPVDEPQEGFNTKILILN